jgi:class 3 adenylate cyclase/phytoene/squalene synthetase
MSRADCISNRNIKIITAYVESLLGDTADLFEGLSFPGDRFRSAKEYFTDEDEWSSYDIFQRIFRRARGLVGDPDFYFNCGASSAVLHSWGRFSYFVQLFSGPNDGIKRLPFFNRNFNDTKDIDIIAPPDYDKKLKKIQASIRVKFHADQDANRDYIGDPYLRGIISSIPTIWGLPRARVEQIMNEYDPEKLLNEEEEFISLGLDARMEGEKLSIYSPLEKKRKIVGRRIVLEPDIIGGRKLFLGRFSELRHDEDHRRRVIHTGILITESLRIENRDILTAGEIFKAPYSILVISYEKVPFWKKLIQPFYQTGKGGDTAHGMIETINQLREVVAAKNIAHKDLERVNLELRKAKEAIDHYARNLERMVDERTVELSKAKEELENLNRGLNQKVKDQVEELGRYNELRRYLSPKITERILSNGSNLNTISHRKLMTVLFSDIRGFSDLTDSLEPEEISLLLNNYLSEMTKLIHKHEGTLDKIIGDGIMVFFGDPIPILEHAQSAVLLAIDMQKKTEELKDEWLSYGHHLNIGVGINTGYMTVGNVGSEFHRDYTVIGNQVNVAARLESMAKQGEILVSQRTYSRAKGIIPFEEVGTVNLKGIHSPVRVYRVKYKGLYSSTKIPVKGNTGKEEWKYCRAILPKVSRTFAINIGHLEDDIYRTVLLGYLLFRMADTFEDTEYRNEEEKIRDLQDFSEIFKGGKELGERVKLYESLKYRWKENSVDKDLIENGHRVLRCYFDIPETHRHIIDPLLVETAEGMAQFQRLKLKRHNKIFQLIDEKELEDYCYYVAGIVGVMLTKIFCQRESIRKIRLQLEKFQIHFGLALQLINILKDYKRDIARGWCYIPLTITNKYQIDLNKMEELSLEQTRGIIQDILPRIVTYLDSTLRYIEVLPPQEKSIRMFCIIPVILGYSTLREIAQTRGDKISREEVEALIEKASLYAQSNSLLEEDYREAKKTILCAAGLPCE